MYAVTAASGHLGHAVVRVFASAFGAEHVRGLARTQEKAQDLPVEIFPGDYEQPPQLEASLKGVQFLVVISSMAGPKERIRQHKNVFDAAVRAGVRHIIYTSIMGGRGGYTFSDIIGSNRQSEQDVMNAEVGATIVRNGLYLEPDLESIHHYLEKGEIANSAGEGACLYTTRAALAEMYTEIIKEPEKHLSVQYEGGGIRLTQEALADGITQHYNQSVDYRALSDEEFLEDRLAVHKNDFLPRIIAGIYKGIRMGEFDSSGDYSSVVGQNHPKLDSLISQWKKQHDKKG